jgi:hypothetical protein
VGAVKDSIYFDYLATYGWAILLVAIVFLALFFLGVFNPARWAWESVITPNDCHDLGVLKSADNSGVSFWGVCRLSFCEPVGNKTFCKTEEWSIGGIR